MNFDGNNENGDIQPHALLWQKETIFSLFSPITLK